MEIINIDKRFKARSKNALNKEIRQKRQIIIRALKSMLKEKDIYDSYYHTLLFKIEIIEAEITELKSLIFNESIKNLDNKFRGIPKINNNPIK